jgi:anti-anti-sigma factor
VDSQSPIPNSASCVAVTPVVLSGSLDQYNAESLKQELMGVVTSRPRGRPELLLDMTAVEHLDASCLQVLLAVSAGLTQDRPAIKGAKPSIRQWVQIAGVDALFDFLDTDD